MPLHYTKSGALDMRYSSSRAAASSGSYGGSSGGSSSSGYGGYGGSYSSSSSGLHYKNDGSLDMRYSSSKSAAATTSGYSSPCASTPNSNLHFKKDGSLDMRYSSSQATVSSASYGSSTSRSSLSANRSSNSPSSSGLHYKKDGSLDMRYSSSKSAEATSIIQNSNMHFKKDGSLDMRYSSSKQVATSGFGSTSLNAAMNKMTLKGQASNIPSHIPLTRSGLPDMRTNAAKDWVASEASRSNTTNQIPSWVPRRKDGSVDTSKAVAVQFFNANPSTSCTDAIYDENQRLRYYKDRLENDLDFCTQVKLVRSEPVPLPTYEVEQIPNLTSALSELSDSRMSMKTPDCSFNLETTLESQQKLNQIDYKDISLVSEEKELGRGGFGIVLLGIWKGAKVAVKKMHLQKLTVKEKRSFMTEVTILSSLSQHVNLVTLHGYTLDPLTLILEFVERGSLSQLLHYEDDPQVEAKMTDGRVKKNLIVGIIQGMIQLHAHLIVHGDLKPQNILVSKDYAAKIADFGLATIRGKTSATVASKNFENQDDDCAGGGTAAYMAIELLDSNKPPELSSDVYSFGILMNEIIMEEEPYSDQYKNFVGRGPFGAVNYARLGNRPALPKVCPKGVKSLIQKCWNAEPSKRPIFKDILNELEQPDMDIPNSF